MLWLSHLGPFLVLFHKAKFFVIFLHKFFFRHEHVFFHANFLVMKIFLSWNFFFPETLFIIQIFLLWTFLCQDNFFIMNIFFHGNFFVMQIFFVMNISSSWTLNRANSCHNETDPYGVQGCQWSIIKLHF